MPHLATFTQCREILEARGDTEPEADTVMAAYHSRVWECWVSLVRLVVQGWHSRDPQSLVVFLEVWRPLIPIWIMQHLLEQLVLTRLKAEVEEWYFLTDTTPIHTCLHCKLRFLGDRLDCVFPTLFAWHPTNRSAKLIPLP